MSLNNNAIQWVKALRSGKYKQAWGHLKTREGFCCLGVACELYRKATGNGSWFGYGHTIGTPCYVIRRNKNDSITNSESIGHLPDEVRDWLGLNSNSGHYDSESVSTPECRGSLTQDNDIAQLTFDEIADLIESEPRGLFKDVENELKGA